MGEHNNAPVEDTQNNNESQEQKSEGRGRKGGLLLDYSLTPMKGAAVFTLHKQHPNVTDFLNRVGTFSASNGIRIALGEAYPEWKESTGVIYLDGTNGKALNRPDTTRLAPVLKYHKNDTDQLVVKGRQVRNNKIARFHAALAELCEVVSETYHFTEYEADKVNVGRVRIAG